MADHEQHVSTREFDGAVRAITEAIADGFQGVNDRLDKVNGRLDRHDTSILYLTPRVAEHGVKIQNLNHEVFKTDGYRHGRKDDPPPAASTDNDPITMKDLKRALWVAGAIFTTIGALFRYGPVIMKAIAPDVAP